MPKYIKVFVLLACFAFIGVTWNLFVGMDARVAAEHDRILA